jgi:hypothetical protein
VGEDRKMRRLPVLVAAGTIAAVAAPAASAAPGCSVPDHPAWHSCLSAGHRAVTGTDQVRLTRATPVLVIRLSACPDNVFRRRVTLRTRSGDRIARKRVTGHCHKGVIRYRTNLRPDVELKIGTTIQSFWSRLPDEDDPASVKLTLEN